MKRYSVADNTGTKERVRQRGIDHSVQASPTHNRRPVDQTKGPQSAKKSESDGMSTMDQSSSLDENQIQVTVLPSEVQEMMVDMKAVDSRASTLNLSQISLKQKESPRAKNKQNNLDVDAASHLQIEGQGVKVSPGAAKLSPRFTNPPTAARTDQQRIDSPKSSTRMAHDLQGV